MIVALNDGREFQVWFRYERMYHENEFPAGVQTSCFLHNKALSKEGVIYEHAGHALCSPEDQFVKEKGRKLALARALQEFPPQVRAEFWWGYHNR